MEHHVGRSFEGHPLEDQCPCPKEPCGLVNIDRAVPECEEHPMGRAKTIRQGHSVDDCRPRGVGASRHRVTIEDGKLTSFQCLNPEADCHYYPACDCESYATDHAKTHGAGHEYVKHADCWLKDWFDCDGAVYVGDGCNDATDHGIPHGMNRSGLIEHEYDDCILWSFTESEATN